MQRWFSEFSNNLHSTSMHVNIPGADTIIETEKLALVQYPELHYALDSDFICFSPVSFSAPGPNPGYPPCCLKLSCLVGPLWSGTAQPLLFFDTLEDWSGILSDFGCLIVFLWFGGNTQRCSACLITLYHGLHDVSRTWLVVTLVTWWRWYLLGLCSDVTVVSFAGLVLGSHYSVQLTFRGSRGILHYLNSLGKICVVFSLYLFHHLYVSVWTHVFICTLGYWVIT